METQMKWWYWSLGAAVALMLGMAPAACSPEPVAAKPIQTASARMMQKQAEADAAVAALAAVYEEMSDEERMKGVVYE